MSSNVKPWELAENLQSTGFPSLIPSDQLLVKLAPPKGKGIRDGVVAGFIMTGYYDKDGNKVETVIANPSPDGYKIEFPLGKKGLYATKFRGPNNKYVFKDDETDKWIKIPQEKFTLDFAVTYLSKEITDWANLDEASKEEAIDKYLEDMFMYGLNRDLLLPQEGDKFDVPFVGLQTKLYRQYTAPDKDKGETWGNIRVTKWVKGEPSLDGEFETKPEALALAVYEEYLSRETATESFDPTKFVEDEGDVI